MAKAMHADEFNRIMAKLGLTQGQMAELLGKSIRAVHGYANGADIPILVARFLRVVVKHDIDISSIR